MKKPFLLTLVTLALALAAAPAALAAPSPGLGGPASGVPTRGTAGPAGTAGRSASAARLRTRLERIRRAVRLLHRCAAASKAQGAPAGGPSQERCASLEARLVTALDSLDAAVQKRIATIQQTCGAGSTDSRCGKADQRVQRLQKLDGRIQALAAKIRSTFGAPASSGVGA